MNKKVIYTSVFGCSEENNYHLHSPDVDLKGYDLVCFTDNPNYELMMGALKVNESSFIKLIITFFLNS